LDVQELQQEVSRLHQFFTPSKLGYDMLSTISLELS